MISTAHQVSLLRQTTQSPVHEAAPTARNVAILPCEQGLRTHLDTGMLRAGAADAARNKGKEERHGGGGVKITERSAGAAGLSSLHVTRLDLATIPRKVNKRRPNRYAYSSKRVRAARRHTPQPCAAATADCYSAPCSASVGVTLVFPLVRRNSRRHSLVFVSPYFVVFLHNE